MLTLACACAALVIAALLPATALAGWQSVGDLNTFTDPFLAPADVGGSAWVAHTDVNSSLHVHRLADDGQTWVEVGDGPISSGNVFSPPSLVGADGVPYVAWTQGGPGPSQLHVARFDAATGTWVEPEPGTLNVDTGSTAGYPSLATLDGSVYVSWWEHAPGMSAELYVKRLDANDHWEQPVPGTLKTYPGRDVVGGTHLAAHDGHLFVGWTEQNGTTPVSSDGNQIFVKRLSDDGTSWEDAAAQPVGDNAADYPTIEGLVSAGGDLYLAEQDWRTYKVRVKRLDGDPREWQPVGGPLNVYPDGRAGAISIAAVSGVPYATWLDGETKDAPREIRVKRLNAAGDDWEEPVTGALNDTPGEFAYEPAIAAVGSTPYVVWPQLRPGDAIRLYGKRLVPDVTPPGDDGAGVTIDGGARFTNDRDVTLDLSAPAGAEDVLISNSADLTGASTSPLAAKVAWRLAGPDGPATVYARFGGDSRTLSDGIVLDETPPTIRSAKLNRRGRLRVAARDATSGVRYVQVARRRSRHASRRRYHATITVARSARAVYVRVVDRAGNASPWLHVARGR